MTIQMRVETFGTRVPDAAGWRGVPFPYPAEAASDGGKHDGGPMPPEAPRDPRPTGGDTGGA
ncbi:hypothetical protein [Streptomyces sp. DW26H14]|uniref:hypothetical protein n=1 Tax=Streptomyces sp. DW26H14 TaxID=3435395 RepID=UPI00403D6273